MSERLPYCPVIEIPRTEPTVTFDVRWGEVFECVNADTKAISLIMSHLGMSTEDANSKTINISADSRTETWDESISLLGDCGLDKATVYLGSVYDCILKNNKDGMFADLTGLQASWVSSAVLAHELFHLAELTNIPIKDLIKERQAYDKKLLAAAKYSVALATGALSGAAEWLIYQPNIIAASVAGSLAMAASLWPAKLLASRFKDDILDSYRAYKNRPMERRAFGFERLYKNLLREKATPFLIGAAPHGEKAKIIKELMQAELTYRKALISSQNMQ